MPLLPNGLTFKQDKFVDKFVQSQGNGTQSALEVYDTDDYDTASVIANENLSKPKIRDEVLRRFHEQNFGIKEANKILLEELSEKSEQRRHYLRMFYELSDAFPDKHTTEDHKHHVILEQRTIDVIINASREAINKAKTQTIEVKKTKKKLT